MKRIIILCYCSAIAIISNAQQESFDLASYIPPKGWKKEAQPVMVTYSTTDKKNNTWCQIGILKSSASKGSIDLDFDSDWQELIATPYGSTQAPQVNAVQDADGWKIKGGGGSITVNQSAAIVLLTTITGFNLRISIVAMTNSQDYLKSIESFLGSLDLKKPAAADSDAGNKNNTVPTLPAGNNGGYTFTTTSFDDGWVASVQPDWIQVVKGSTAAYLHFGIAYTDETRNLPEEKRIAYFWNLLVSPRHRVDHYTITPSEADYNRVYFADGDGIDISTGNPVHVALMLTAENGYAKCLEIITPDKNSLTQQFPNYDKMKLLYNYNKFAVGPTDVLGNWGNSSSAYGQYYYTATGNYAGMSGVSISDKFDFRSGNRYHYEYVGASGMVGSQQVHTEKKDGNYKISNWEMVLTDNTGKTTEYFAQFEAVRGGRILHLQNKKYSGMQYHLYKQH